MSLLGSWLIDSFDTQNIRSPQNSARVKCTRAGVRKALPTHRVTLVSRVRACFSCSLAYHSRKFENTCSLKSEKKKHNKMTTILPHYWYSMDDLVHHNQVSVFCSKNLGQCCSFLGYAVPFAKRCYSSFFPLYHRSTCSKSEKKKHWKMSEKQTTDRTYAIKHDSVFHSF